MRTRFVRSRETAENSCIHSLETGENSRIHSLETVENSCVRSRETAVCSVALITLDVVSKQECQTRIAGSVRTYWCVASTSSETSLGASEQRYSWTVVGMSSYSTLTCYLLWYIGEGGVS